MYLPKHNYELLIIIILSSTILFAQQNNWSQFENQKSPYQVYLEVEEENNRITDKTYQSYDQNSGYWVNVSRSSYQYAYYGNYNGLQYYYYYYYSNGWVYAYYYYYYYDNDGNLTGYDYFGYYDGQWEHWGTGEYSNFNSSGDWGTETYTNINSRSGMESTKTDRYFDNDGNVTDEYKSWLDGNDYKNQTWTQTDINNGYVDQKTYYNWNTSSNSWVNAWMYNYSYDNGYNSQVGQSSGYLYYGSPTSWTGYSWNGGTWTPYQYCMYGFNNGYTSYSTYYNYYDTSTSLWSNPYARTYYSYHNGAGKMKSPMDISNSRLRLVETEIPGATEGEWIKNDRTWFSYENNTVNTEGENSIPTSISLEQNYPNPFNPSTNIEFSIDKNSDVILSIYDITGKMVKELVNKNYQVGVHSIKWNGTDLNGDRVSSGIYIYTLESNNNIISKKMIMMN